MSASCASEHVEARCKVELLKASAGAQREYYYDDSGTMRNSGFLDYRMPTCLDLPMIETILVEGAEPRPSYRYSWCRRGADRPAAAAIANAIYAPSAYA